MPARAPPGERPEEELDEEEKKGMVERLLAALGLGEQQPQAQPGLINGIDIARLIDYVFSDTRRVQVASEELSRVKGLLERVNAVTRELVDVYTMDGLSRVYHPVYGEGVLDARVSELTLLLRQVIRSAWQEGRELIRSNAPPEEVARAADRAETLTQLSYLVAVEAYAKLITIYMANAPPRARPPLVNVALGYDIVE